MIQKKIKFSSLQENVRIDKYISEIFFLSRSHVSKIINQGMLLVNNKKIKPSYPLKKHDVIEIVIQSPKKLKLEPQNLKINILYQDEDIAVIDKPAGMVVHPSPGHRESTLVNALLYHCKDLSGINDVLRPGIVHRLDKDTSGLMVIAKNNNSHLNLANQFKNRIVKKFYKALVYGIVKPEKGRIENLIGRHKKNRLKFSSFTSSGKIAITNYIVAEYFKNFSLLDINIETGRTHQIRVHFSEKGYPIVGDTLYGNKKSLKRLSRKIQTEIEKLNRVFLHSYKLEFIHPKKNIKLNFKTEVPPELQKMIEVLHGD